MTDEFNGAPRTREEALAAADRILAEHAGEAVEWFPMDGTAFQPRVLPAAWSATRGETAYHPTVYQRGTSKDRLLVMLSAMRHATHGEWLHLSASYRDRVPSWATMCDLKDVFIGVDRVAVQVHPRKDAHANLHPHCLHLWARLDRDAAPDFRTLGMI